MDIKTQRLIATRMNQYVVLFVAVLCALLPLMAAAQVLTGALIGTVRDEQGAVVQGAVVNVSSPALIGGVATLNTDEKGQLRFSACLRDYTFSTSRCMDLRPYMKWRSGLGRAPLWSEQSF
jgi:hypothetical protein